MPATPSRTPRLADSPADLKARLDAHRREVPFVHLRDADGTQHILTLDPGRQVLTIGRAEQCDVSLAWDREVSRLHARLERSAGAWTICDDGLSRNGTFLNGDRVHGRRVLHDRDVVRTGMTDIAFCDPAPQRSATLTSDNVRVAEHVSPAQRKVLLALCAPYRDRSAFTAPPSNDEIAAQLVVSVDAVKSHLKALFAKFELETLPRNEKRIRLVEEAFARGVVRDSDFDSTAP